MSGASKFGGSTRPVVRSIRRRKSGKAQPVIVVKKEADIEAGAAQPIFIVDVDYVAANGLISGAALPVAEVAGRRVKGGHAQPVYVVAGTFDD